MEMTTFQLDECFDNPELAKRCTDEGACQVHRYPHAMRGAGIKDDMMLPYVFRSNKPLLTIDRLIVEENGDAISTPNPGIIVIVKKTPPPMTHQAAIAIIARFKERYPLWASVNWSMIYARIEEDDVYISPLVDFNINDGEQFSMKDPDFADKVTKYVAEITSSIRRLSAII